MELTFVTDLNESKQYRSKQAISRVTARQVADHTFMDMIALWILFNEFDYAPEAISYAGSTVQYNKFSNYRQSANDLYLNLHIITEKRTDLLSPDPESVVLLDRMFIDSRNIVRYLRQMTSNNLSPSKVRQTLQRLEQNLYIENSNYRSIRRLAQSWPTLDTNRKRAVLTRMMMFYKVHARRSEMYQMISALAKSHNLNDKNATNPEKPGLLKTAAAAGAAGAAGFAVGHRIGKSLF